MDELVGGRITPRVTDKTMARRWAGPMTVTLQLLAGVGSVTGGFAMTHDTTGSARKRNADTVKVKIKGAWTAIPNKLLLDQRLSREARLLGCLIFMHAGNSGRAFPSQEKMAEELGCVRRSIIRWLEELQHAGWVEWRQTMRNNEYTLKDPDEIDQPEQDSSHKDALTSVTPASLHVIPESHPSATQRSHPVTQESHSSVTPVSAPMTQESHSSLLDSYNRDSYNRDSSSSDTTPTHHPVDGDDVPTPTELFLQEENLGVAKELRDMPLELTQRYVADAKQRGASLPAIAKGLRARWKREQARRREQAAAAAPPDWIDDLVWPTLPDELRLALHGTTIDDEGYLCYDGIHEAAIVAHEATVKALVRQARREEAVGAGAG